MLIACRINACMSLLCCRCNSQPPAASTHLGSCCLRQSYPAAPVASRDAWCYRICCYGSHSAAVTTCDAFISAEQLQLGLAACCRLQLLRGVLPVMALPLSSVDFYQHITIELRCRRTARVHGSVWCQTGCSRCTNSKAIADNRPISN